MALIADSGGLYALYDADDAHHAGVRKVIERERGPVIIPVPVLTELDYLLRVHLGVEAELDCLDSIISGAFSLEPPTLEDLKHCRELISKYRDLDLGLADASAVTIAERLGIHRILTVDECDFRTVRPKRGKPFILLPADADRDSLNFFKIDGSNQAITRQSASR